jgi:hypothetical protein
VDVVVVAAPPFVQQVTMATVGCEPLFSLVTAAAAPDVTPRRFLEQFDTI